MTIPLSHSWASEYPVGSRLLLNGRWPVEVTGHTSLPDDLVVRWLGMAPSLDDVNTICLRHLTSIETLAGQ